MQENHPACSRVAQHILVLGSGSYVKSNSTVPAPPAQSADSTIQSDSTQDSVEPKSLCLTRRASAIKEQNFSMAVAAQIEATQRGQTR